MPGMNEVIDASKSHWGNYRKMKAHWGGLVILMARTQGFECKDGGHFTYLFSEPDRKRDPSNFVAGAIKIIEDALQDDDRLGNDGWKHVKSITSRWRVSRPSGVTLIVTDEEPTESEIEQWQTR